jgi:hypothetical protein
MSINFENQSEIIEQTDIMVQQYNEARMEWLVAQEKYNTFITQFKSQAEILEKNAVEKEQSIYLNENYTKIVEEFDTISSKRGRKSVAQMERIEFLRKELDRINEITRPMREVIAKMYYFTRTL